MFASKLDEIMVRMQLKLDFVAERTGLNGSRISLLRRRKSRPTVRETIALENYFAMDIDDLLAEYEKEVMQNEALDRFTNKLKRK